MEKNNDRELHNKLLNIFNVQNKAEGYEKLGDVKLTWGDIGTLVKLIDEKNKYKELFIKYVVNGAPSYYVIKVNGRLNLYMDCNGEGKMFRWATRFKTREDADEFIRLQTSKFNFNLDVEVLHVSQIPEFAFEDLLGND